jgi:hypothetical protein
VIDLLAKFDRAKPTKDGHMVKCPAHDDGTASLSISRGKDGRWLLHCFANCTTENVCAALRIKPADLFPDREASKPSPSKKTGFGKPVAEYNYTDASGKFEFQVCRTDTKEFPIRTRDEKGNWKWGLNGARRFLYRLPDVIAARMKGETIYICEGEKDVAVMVAHGFCATCNPGGASKSNDSKWIPQFNETLRGADVVIIPDNDPAGEVHAKNVANNLRGLASRVRTIKLPFGKDAHDFFADGGTAEELERLCANAIQETAPACPDPIRTATPATKTDLLILPSGEVSISEAAQAIFSRIAPSRTIFRRGGALVELSRADGFESLSIVHPEAFRSRVEKFGNLHVWRSDRNGEPVLKASKMSLDDAKAIMACIEARELPAISSVLRCATLTERPLGEVAILAKGYHTDLGGLMVLDGATPPDVSFDEAVATLLWLINEFDFQSEGDRSRALAAFLTPALRIGGHLRGNIPIDCAEADQSQAGKGFRHEMVCKLYNEQSYFVTAKRGGVGSVDESFSSGLISGRPFICLDNFRGKIDSANLEAFLTCPTYFPARIPNRGEVLIDPKRFILQLSSNGLEATRDLANRASICRIKKRPGFAYRDTITEIRIRQPYFLGCVFSILTEWLRRGKPRTSDTRHDFREWNQSLDWIVQNLLGCAPLMDGHQAAQERTSDPALSWLRVVALAVEAEGKLGEPLTATELVEICAGRAIEIPGKPIDADTAKRQAGILCKRVFGNGHDREVDDFKISKGPKAYRKPSGDLDTTNAYTFSRL